MHPTATFAAPFGFVGWTISSPPSPRGLPSSLYTFLELRLGSGLPYLSDLGFPEFDRICLEIALQVALAVNRIKNIMQL
jgi:hypothetical protein